MIIVATTSLPAVDRLNADRWYAARSRQHPHQNLPKGGILEIQNFAQRRTLMEDDLLWKITFYGR